MPTSSAASALVYIYDGLDRLTKKNVSFSTLHDLYEEYSYYGYTSGGVQYTTPLVSSLTLKKDSTTTATYSYTYDSLGNILTVSKDDSLIYAYEYDSLNQLTREDDVAQGTSTLFDYDLSGNITARHIFPYWAGCPTSQLRTLIGIDQYCTTVSYGYSAGTWGDMLTSYNGTTITYDSIGNPTKWRNALGLTWSGKQLTYIAIDGLDEGLGASYNADGIRTKKTYWDENANQTVHDYVLDGSKIVKETVTGSSSYTMYYYYDAAGSIAGFEYNGSPYYYQKNLQGDIIRICNALGNTVVEYTYNAWGEVLGFTGSLANTIGKINPFRYRGYYYDTETGFYYLQTRYYDPVVGRWLNTEPNIDYGCFDQGAGLLSGNIYVYCANNPVRHFDPTGEFILACIIIGAAIGTVAGGIYGHYQAKKAGYSISNGWSYFKYLLGYGLLGGAAGALIGTGIGYVGTYVIAASAKLSGMALFGKVIKSAGMLVGLAEQYLEKTKTPLNIEQVKYLLSLCNDFGVRVVARLKDLTVGHGAWSGIPHLHIGDKEIHIALTKEAAEFIIKLFGLE